MFKELTIVDSFIVEFILITCYIIGLVLVLVFILHRYLMFFLDYLIKSSEISISTISIFILCIGNSTPDIISIFLTPGPELYLAVISLYGNIIFSISIFLPILIFINRERRNISTYLLNIILLSLGVASTFLFLLCWGRNFGIVLCLGLIIFYVFFMWYTDVEDEEFDIPENVSQEMWFSNRFVDTFMMIFDILIFKADDDNINLKYYIYFLISHIFFCSFISLHILRVSRVLDNIFNIILITLGVFVINCILLMVFSSFYSAFYSIIVSLSTCYMLINEINNLLMIYSKDFHVKELFLNYFYQTIAFSLPDIGISSYITYKKLFPIAAVMLLTAPIQSIIIELLTVILTRSLLNLEVIKIARIPHHISLLLYTVSLLTITIVYIYNRYYGKLYDKLFGVILFIFGILNLTLTMLYLHHYG